MKINLTKINKIYSKNTINIPSYMLKALGWELYDNVEIKLEADGTLRIRKVEVDSIEVPDNKIKQNSSKRASNDD